MSSFHYRALAGNGKMLTGVLSGDDVRSVSRELRRQGMTPVFIGTAKPGGFSITLPKLGREPHHHVAHCKGTSLHDRAGQMSAAVGFGQAVKSAAGRGDPLRRHGAGHGWQECQAVTPGRHGRGLVVEAGKVAHADQPGQPRHGAAG